MTNQKFPESSTYDLQYPHMLLDCILHNLAPGNWPLQTASKDLTETRKFLLVIVLQCYPFLINVLS